MAMAQTGAVESAYADHLAEMAPHSEPQDDDPTDDDDETAVRKESDPSFAGFGVPFDRLEGLRHIAEGGMCSVYKCRFAGKNLVLKVPRQGVEDAVAELDNELAVLQIAKHQNIIRMVGAGLTPQGETFMLTEELSGGTLAARLGTEGRGGGIPRWLFRRLFMGMADALTAAAGAASAIAYMHDRLIPGTRVLHRDIKSTNLAFAADGVTLKLFDFGLARILRPQERETGISGDVYKMTGGTGSLRYMAPEVALSLPYNEKADVYSFSMVLWEMLAVQRPFSSYTPDLMMERVVNGIDRPPLEKHWPPELRQLLTSMWDRAMEKRPPMYEVTERLRSLAAEERAKSYG